MLELFLALVRMWECKRLAKVMNGGVRSASGRQTSAKEFKRGEDWSGTHIFVLATADSVVQACEGRALFIQQVNSITVAAEG